MGAEPWSYFVPYRVDVEAALDDLKEQEFAAGRYQYSGDPDFPPETIQDVVEASDADGTQSILDMMGLGDALRDYDTDAPSVGQLAPLSASQLIAIYGTERPSHAMVENDRGLYELLDRGMGAYVVVYDGNTPSELYFAGYSFD